MLVGYNCFDIPAFKYENQGRPMGGILVFVRSKFEKHFKRVQSECKFAVFIRAEKSLFNTTKDILFSFTYIPPDSSNAYKHELCKGIDMLEHYILACDIELNEVLLAIIGDINSRTADRLDFIPQEKAPPELEEFNDILYASEYERKSVRILYCEFATNNEWSLWNGQRYW